MADLVLLHQGKHIVVFSLQFGEIEMAVRVDKHATIIAKASMLLPHRYFARRNNSALVTTLTLDNAIAAPAMTGFNKPAAASGMPITL